MGAPDLRRPPTTGRLFGSVRRVFPSAMVRNGWNPLRVALAAALALVGYAVTSDAWADIFVIAGKDEEASHIYLVPVVAAWLFWVRRGRFRQCTTGGTWVGPALVACGWFLHSVGDSYLLQSLWHLGAVVVVLGCIVSLTGKDVLLRFLPSVAVLALLVPVPGTIRQQIAQPLQAATASVTHVVLETIGVPVVLSGNVLELNGVEVAIAEACNGLRMVFALLLVSYAFAFGTPLRNRMRVLVLVASPVSAILCNVVRLVPTVWIYGNYPAEVADRFHDLSGWAMVPIAFLALLGILRLLRWAQVPVTRFVLAYGT